MTNDLYCMLIIFISSFIFVKMWKIIVLSWKKWQKIFFLLNFFSFFLISQVEKKWKIILAELFLTSSQVTDTEERKQFRSPQNTFPTWPLRASVNVSIIQLSADRVCMISLFQVVTVSPEFGWMDSFLFTSSCHHLSVLSRSPGVCSPPPLSSPPSHLR